MFFFKYLTEYIFYLIIIFFILITANIHIDDVSALLHISVPNPLKMSFSNPKNSSKWGNWSNFDKYLMLAKIKKIKINFVNLNQTVKIW